MLYRRKSRIIDKLNFSPQGPYTLLGFTQPPMQRVPGVVSPGGEAA
jgi:hypothetical protein